MDITPRLMIQDLFFTEIEKIPKIACFPLKLLWYDSGTEVKGNLKNKEEKVVRVFRGFGQETRLHFELF